MTAEQVVQRDPVRNEAWALCDGTFVAEASTLGDSRTDPWNRPLPKMLPEYDRCYEDVLAWNGVTTVRGKLVRLALLND